MLIVSNIHQAKTNLSKLLDQVQKGKEVVIAKAGVPIAKLVLFDKIENKRVPGTWKGKAWISPDFDKEDKEIEKLFSEGSI